MSDVGHLDFLQKAADLGDYVIVGLHSDSVSLNLCYSCYTLTDKVEVIWLSAWPCKGHFHNFFTLRNTIFKIAL